MRILLISVILLCVCFSNSNAGVIQNDKALYFFNNYSDAPILLDVFFTTPPNEVQQIKKVIADHFVKKGLKPFFVNVSDLDPLAKCRYDHFYDVQISNSNNGFSYDMYLMRKTKYEFKGKKFEFWMPVHQGSHATSSRKKSMKELAKFLHESGDNTLSSVVDANK